MAKIAVIGAGSWGSALALQLARRGHEVHLWGRDAQHMHNLRRDGENKRYLCGFSFPHNLIVNESVSSSLNGAQLILLVVPSHAFAAILRVILPYVNDIPIMWAIKGFYDGRLLHEVFHEILGIKHPHALLAGPSFAKEVAANLPTAVSIVASDQLQAGHFANYFHGSAFLCYTDCDLIGAQIGGAVKNVIAIATGIADGLNCGANSRAALITRGLREMTRLAVALGGREKTLSGLTGMGDLVLTATDNQSRNRRFGLALAAGKSAAQARQSIAQVVEGEKNILETWQLACNNNIHMPITEQLYYLLTGQSSLQDAVNALVNRAIKNEHH